MLKEFGKFYFFDFVFIYFIYFDFFEFLLKFFFEVIDFIFLILVFKKIFVVFYDFDGILVKIWLGNDFFKSWDDWMWWYFFVFEKLK